VSKDLLTSEDECLTCWNDIIKHEAIQQISPKIINELSSRSSSKEQSIPTNEQQEFALTSQSYGSDIIEDYEELAQEVEYNHANIKDLSGSTLELSIGKLSDNQKNAPIFGLEVMLSQLDEKGQEHVITYTSRILNKAEKNYAATVIWASKHFHVYVYKQKIKLVTDYSVFKHLFNTAITIERTVR